MSSRLYDRLGRWVVMEDAALASAIADIEGPLPGKDKLIRARRLFAHAIETPGGLKIQTIHAFCERLLGRFPLEARVPPNFDVMDERAARELLLEVRDEVLARARADGAGPLGRSLSLIVTRIDEQSFANLLTEIAGKRRLFALQSERFGGIEGAVRAIRLALGVGPDEATDDVRATLFAAPTFPEAGLREALQVFLTGTVTDEKQAAKLAPVLEAKTGREALAESYVGIFLTDKQEPRKNVITKKPADKFPAVARLLAEEQARVVAYVERLKAAEVVEASEAILRLADEILKGFAEAKRRRAFLDYEDLIDATRDLLLKSAMAPWVLYKLDGGIDHILVDEAQDTSPEQWDVISEIAVEFLSGAGARAGSANPVRTIFAVGDEKQSIFSFQGADPVRFDAMRRHFERSVKAAELKWEAIPLVRSFRSAPEVLKAVDAVFATDVAREGLTASGVVEEHVPVRAGDAGLVEIWDIEKADDKEDPDPWDVPLDYMNEADPRSRLATRIAETIEGWRKSGETLAATGRAIEPGDILILVRRRDAFVAEMIRKLKEKGIPAAGADRMVLIDEIAVMDLMALGRFVLLPGDDLTLATVLKSPLVGFTEDDLFDLAYGRETTLWRALQARRDERRSFTEAHALLARLLERADYAPPYEFFSHVLGEERGRARLFARLGPDAGDPIDEFLALALDFERDHAPSLQAFLHWIERGAAEIKRDMDKGRNEVRIMTVHGAKGLEAGIVFMPDTCAVPGGSHDPGLITLSSETKLLLWPVRVKSEDMVTAGARLAGRQARDDEYRRLLYVAMTRARDRLYICGHLGKSALPEKSWYALVVDALKPLATEVVTDGRTVWRIEGTQKNVPKSELRAAEAPLPGLQPWSRLPAAPEPSPSRPLAPSRMPPDGAVEPPALSPLAGDTSRRYRRGKLIHRLLQTLPDLPESAREDTAHRFLGGPSHGLDEAERAEIAAATLAVLREPSFAPIFAEGSRAEVAIVGRIDFAGKPALVSGQIDRLCVTEPRVLVVDYKTNRPAPPRLEDVAPAYLAQMAAYRAVLAQVYPGREIACALLWTDGPKLMELPPETLDRVLSAASGRS
jgi:ATP-dependent helicase/nuclease subunit A